MQANGGHMTFCSDVADCPPTGFDINRDGDLLYCVYTTHCVRNADAAFTRFPLPHQQDDQHPHIYLIK
jgi:hypothetical protein